MLLPKRIILILGYRNGGKWWNNAGKSQRMIPVLSHDDTLVTVRLQPFTDLDRDKYLVWKLQMWTDKIQISYYPGPQGNINENTLA